MIKAWEKAQKYAGKIENFKYWLTTLTRNFWEHLTFAAKLEIGVRSQESGARRKEEEGRRKEPEEVFLQI